MKIFLIIAALFLITNYYLPITNVAFAQQVKLAPDCDPKLPPNDPNACNITAFIKWIKQLINFLLTIAIPIGVLFIAYGAFVIMTAGGSEERVRKGKDVITAAVVGIAIAFGAWLIVTTINQILGFKQPLPPGSEIIGPGKLRQTPGGFEGF